MNKRVNEIVTAVVSLVADVKMYCVYDSEKTLVRVELVKDCEILEIYTDRNYYANELEQRAGAFIFKCNQFKN